MSGSLQALLSTEISIARVLRRRSCGSAPPGSRRARRSRSSTSPSSAPSRRQVIEHLGQLDFLHASKRTSFLLGPPGTGKTHLAIALGIRACLAGQRVLFKTATEWVALLADAQRQGRLDDELKRLERIPLLVCDEVGYIPFDPQAANLMFMLVARRYERASLIVTSNKPFSAVGRDLRRRRRRHRMVDRLVHHAELLSLKGDSYRARSCSDAGSVYIEPDGATTGDRLTCG